MAFVDKYTGTGAVGGGAIGFYFGGPVGAAIGATVGYIAGKVAEPKTVSGGGGSTPGKIPPSGVNPAPSPFSPPKPTVVPGVVPAPPLPVQPPIPPSPAPVVQSAAAAMNTALTAHGYKQADMPLYMAFQRTAGLTVDGYPGPKTMAALQVALNAIGVTMAPVKVYPWSASGGYDGQNAPTIQEWSGNPAFSGPPPMVSTADAAQKPTASQVAAVMPIPAGTPIVSNQDIQRALNALGYASPLLVADGSIGPKSKAAVLAFQKDHGLTQDGIPGPQTKAALQTALAALHS
jgi:peptidoglycan hydrolase-like protein with peptidoglycan-binding domain